MKQFRHGISGLAFLGAAALLAVSCGGDDEGGEGGAAKGGSGGKGTSGSTGKGSSGAGSGGRSGAANGGEPNEAGAPSSGGAAGQTGGEGGSNAGAGGGETEAIILTPGDEVSAMISAEDGGTITLGRLSLEIPPDALDEDTEITIKGFAESGALFVLEPDGLSFDTPVRAHFTYPAAPPGEAEEEELTIVFAETAGLGDPSELVSADTLQRTGDTEYRATVELEHFSYVHWFQVRSDDLVSSQFVTTTDLTPFIIDDVPVGVEFGLVHAYSLPESSDFSFTVEDDEEKGFSDRFDGRITSVSLLSTTSYPAGTIAALPAGDEAVDGAPAPLGPAPLSVTRLFRCESEGEAEAGVGPRIHVQADIRRKRLHLEFDESVGYRYFRELEVEEASDVTVVPTYFHLDSHPLTCVDRPSVVRAFANPSIAAAMTARVKAAFKEYCTFLSDDSSCQSPNPDLAITNVLDPVFQVGPNAAARIEAAFPCGAGPLGTTVCGTQGAFATGEYVFLLATFGGDIPTDDPVGLFQHAFVFDADGITSNNYVPSSQFPKDFFQGTDKWYQLFYTPTDGFSLRVIDARVSTSSPVASGARLIVAGREFAAFIPRAELDGTSPGFRVSTFRHEGDYGLDGGPWSASYHPPLDEPLMPAAAGEVIVLPED
jgi:hypothetical protein